MLAKPPNRPRKHAHKLPSHYRASVVGAAGFFETYRFYFLAATGLLLVAAYYLVYFRKPRCQSGSTCAAPNAKLTRFNKVMLSVATVAVLLFALFPNYLGALTGGGNDSATASAAIGDSRLFQIEGMTCQGCATNLQSQLVKVPGVVRAEVSYEAGTARVYFNSATAPPSDGSIQQAIQKAGFRGSPVEG